MNGDHDVFKTEVNDYALILCDFLVDALINRALQ